MKVVLRNKRTVLEEFEAGSNVVQVMDQLAPIRKKDFYSAYDSNIAAILPVLRDFAPEMPIVPAAFPSDLKAKGVPGIADRVLRLTRPSHDENLVDTFNRERRAFERNTRVARPGAQRPGHLVRLYTEGHGAFGDPDLTRKLLDNLPMHVVERRLPMTNLINDAIRERRFYYLSAAASQSVDDLADGRIPIPEEYDLPSTTGFAVMSGDDEAGGSDRVLLWSHGAGELTAALLSVTDLRTGVIAHPTVASARAGSVPGDDGALSLVTAIAEATGRPASRSTAGRSRVVKSRGTGGVDRPLKGLSDDEKHADQVSLIYAPGEVVAEAALRGTGRKAEKRWMVSGHWRQQPYPSTGERRPVYIKEHQSGAADGALWLGDRVRVPRPL
jgi:hypothetical protein